MQDLKENISITRRAYGVFAQTYHERFKDELSQKAYDRKLLDTYAQFFSPRSIIYDAGCGPSGHIGRYLFDKGLSVRGLDISEHCIDIARKHNPDMKFERMDMMNLKVDDRSIDGLISFYSIIHTPKFDIHKIFQEFKRVLKIGGKILLAVKEGKGEGLEDNILDSQMPIYFSYFTEKEIKGYFISNGFKINFLECRAPYSDEISISRIYAIAESV